LLPLTGGLDHAYGNLALLFGVAAALIGSVTFGRAEPRAGKTRYGFTFGRGTKVRVELFIDTRDKQRNKAIFDALKNEQPVVEAEFGNSLSWEPLPKKDGSRIASDRDGSINDDDNTLREIKRWAIQRLLKFKQVFNPRLAELSKATTALPPDPHSPVLERVCTLQGRAHDYLSNDPESAMNQARKAAEAICKDIYRAKGLEAGGRLAAKQELDELMTALNRKNVLPGHILQHFKCVRDFGNYGSHDQGETISPETAKPCIAALDNLVRWYRRDVLHQDLEGQGGTRSRDRV
jgi:hypothetical protein